jgi:hypothetical protein
MQGWILPHHEDRDGDSTRCHVCGGSGTIPDDEYAAWMQDPAFVRNLSEYTPHNYSDFYAHAYLRYRESEVRAGRMPTMTLAEFVAFRRAEQGAPPIDPRYVRAAQPVGEFRVPCIGGCFNGTTSSYHDQDTSYPCRMCAPHGGRGSIPASTVAEWMRDEGYRAYCARTCSSNRESYATWSAQATREAQRRASRESAARESARESAQREAQRRGAHEAAARESAREARRREILEAAARESARESARATTASVPSDPRARAAAAAEARWAAARASRTETSASWETLISQARGSNERGNAPTERDEDESLCVICYTNEKTHLFNNCGHFGYCGQCTATTSRCPMCMTPGRAIRMYRVTFGR